MTTGQAVGAAAVVLLAGVGGYVLAGALGAAGPKCPGELKTTPADVLDAARYPWDQLTRDADADGYDTKGETDHQLIDAQGNPSGKRAAIHRVHKSNSRKKTCFKNKPIAVAKIQSDGDFAPLKLAAGDNYFVVWYVQSGSTEEWHGAIANAQGRSEIPFKFEEHWRNNKPNNPDTEPTAPDEVSTSVKECWKASNPTRRACFVDSRDDWKKPGSSSGGQGSDPPVGVGIGLTAQGLFLTQPWVSCAQYGCCCGGTNCHN